MHPGRDFRNRPPSGLVLLDYSFVMPGFESGCGSSRYSTYSTISSVPAGIKRAYSPLTMISSHQRFLPSAPRRQRNPDIAVPRTSGTRKPPMQSRERTANERTRHERGRDLVPSRMSRSSCEPVHNAQWVRSVSGASPCGRFGAVPGAMGAGQIPGFDQPDDEAVDDGQGPRSAGGLSGPANGHQASELRAAFWPGRHGQSISGRRIGKEALVDQHVLMRQVGQAMSMRGC